MGGFALESALTRVCREAGARVRSNQFLRDLNVFGIRGEDQRRIEIIGDGLSLFHGRQLAVDAILVSALNGNGIAHTGAANHDGAMLEVAWKRKERTYPE